MTDRLGEALAHYDTWLNAHTDNLLAEVVAAARSWHDLTELPGRVLIETPCEHGKFRWHDVEEPVYSDPDSQGRIHLLNQPRCKGATRRPVDALTVTADADVVTTERQRKRKEAVNG